MKHGHAAVDSTMWRRAVRVLVGALLAGAVSWVALPASAAADIAIDAPADSTVGEPVLVTATVTEGGEPVADAVVAVTRKAQLGGASGFAVLDRGVTDASGVVEFEFVQFADSSEVATLRVEYAGPDGVEATEFELGVLPGPQQYSSSSGADIGILNVSWLIIFLALVWILALVAAWQFVVISHNREGESKRKHHVTPYYMFAFVAFTSIGMFYVVLTQPTMHANLAPNEAFDRIPTAYLGEEYDYLGLGANDVATRPDNFTGEVLYIRNGCASCHGLAGEGALVGGELTASLVSDREDVIDAVRRGPSGMPKYSVELLSDTEVDRIIAYILE